jgi:hypothetical protein
MPKRDKPVTPMKVRPSSGADRGKFGSPPQEQESKQLFTGKTAMEEDGQSIPSQEELRKKRLEERAAKKAAFQKTMDQAKSDRVKKATLKKSIDTDDESTVKGEKQRTLGRMESRWERRLVL